MQRGQRIATSIAVSLLLTPASVVAHMAGRVMLNRAFVAHSEFISISDLLPEDAPEKLRARAFGVTLGQAPLPGGHRTFARAQVEQAMRGVPELRSLVEIPSSIEVTRWSRLLTREEVLDAIAEMLRANQLAVRKPLATQDLAFNAPIAVTEDAPKLRVTRIEPAPEGTGTHVRLWTTSEPRTPPFWVTLLTNIEEAASLAGFEPPRENARDFQAHPKPHLGARRNMQPLATGERNSPRRAPREMRFAGSHGVNTPDSSILVRSGEPVRLILQAHGMQLSVKATSLEIGLLGQKVRVRNADTGKILSGTVVAAQTIEADY